MTATHGLVSTRKRGCTCPDCLQAAADYDREYRRRRACGRPTTDLVDAEPARAHAFRLMQLGWTRRGLTRATGVAHLDALLYGRPAGNLAPLKRISSRASRRILTIPLELVPTTKQIDPSGSRRRSQALQTLGYSVLWQAERTNTSRSMISRLLNGSNDSILACHAVAIRDVYDAYWDKPAPANRHTKGVRTRARELGCLPPLAWDDEFLDLPDADLAAELSRRAAAMDAGELYRAYRAHLDGDRSPLIVAGAERYLAVRRESRPSRAAA